MSYRPTVSIYFNGKIMDCIYCRNYSEKSLVLTTMFYAAYLSSCRTEGEVKRRLFGPRKNWPGHYYDEASRDIESWSECPMQVDLTNRCIFYGIGPHTAEDLAGRAEPDLSRAHKLFSDKRPLLTLHTKIPFEMMDLAEIRRQPFFYSMLQEQWRKMGEANAEKKSAG